MNGPSSEIERRNDQVPELENNVKTISGIYSYGTSSIEKEFWIPKYLTAAVSTTL